MTGLLFCLALLIAIQSTAGLAFAIGRVNVEYSADQIIESEEDGTKSRIYSTPTKERRNLSQGGAVMTMITRYDDR